MTNQEKGWENYSNGEKFELRCLYKLRKSNTLTLRSAGSRTPIDIISYRKSGNVWWVSCKRNGYLSPKEWRDLEKLKVHIKEGYGKIILKLGYMSGRRIKFRTI